MYTDANEQIIKSDIKIAELTKVIAENEIFQYPKGDDEDFQVCDLKFKPMFWCPQQYVLLQLKIENPPSKKRKLNEGDHAMSEV